MTQEEKARRYDEALERARKLNKEFTTICGVNMCEEIFPEIKESEDEKIRKDIKQHFLYLDDSFPDKAKWLRWLKKQGEQKRPIEKLPSEMKTIGESLGFTTQEECDEYNQAVSGLIMSDSDKIVPKFNVGDWIVFITNGSVYRVEKIENYEYTLRNILGGSVRLSFSDEYFIRKWTIQDAKDGDVVITESDGTIGIFQSIGHHPDGGSYNDPSYCFLHCRYDDGFFYADFENGNTMDADEKISPATKEQRDTLMKAMTDVGYEWSEETHQLKKIDNEEFNGEDFGIDSLFHAQRILEKTLGKVEGYQSDDGILEHKCAITAVNKLYKQKPVWSKDDEEMIDNIIDYMKPMPIFFESTKGKSGKEYTEEFIKNAINWLKFFKQRMGG